MMSLKVGNDMSGVIKIFTVYSGIGFACVLLGFNHKDWLVRVSHHGTKILPNSAKI